MLEVGDTLPFSARFRDAAGVLTNASTVVLTITLPDGTTAPGITVVNPPALAGEYQYDYVTTTLDGQYTGRWLFTAAGGKTSAHTETFDVAASNPRFIVSLAATKKHLNIDADETDDDEELRDWIGATTELIEDRVGTCIPRTITNEYHDADTTLWLIRTPVLSVTSIVPALGSGSTVLAADVRVESSGRVVRLDGSRFTGGPYGVTYVAGRRPVPIKYRQAAQIIIGHLWETQRGPSALPLNGGDETTVVPGFGFAVPNRALELLGLARPLVA